MKKGIVGTVTAFALVALSACQTGFSLPRGNSENGRLIFSKFQCADCHAIAALPDLRRGIQPLMDLPLGGKTDTLKTYDELVTSIINPSHVISPNYPGKDIRSGKSSKMPSFNSAMTVEELVDLVTFLEAQYELAPYESTLYETYQYPSEW